MAEHGAHNAGVAGSSPVPATNLHQEHQRHRARLNECSTGNVLAAWLLLAVALLGALAFAAAALIQPRA